MTADKMAGVRAWATVAVHGESGGGRGWLRSGSGSWEWLRVRRWAGVVAGWGAADALGGW